MRILGISAFFHDAAAALIVDGEIVAAAQEERFSRIKQDPSLPVQAVEFCLAEANLSMEDVDHVVFYEKPLKKFDRILSSELQGFPRTLSTFTRSMRSWLGKRLWTRNEMCKALGCTDAQLLFSEHHLSHAAAAFLTSPFSEAAVLCVDGVGESATTSIFRGYEDKKGRPKMDLVEEIHFPHSLGLLYSAITAYLGFKVNEGEYKVMGLASYGQPQFREQFAKFVKLDEDDAIELDLSYFSFHRSTTKSFSPKLESLLGKSRTGEALTFPTEDSELQRFADIAATLQNFTTEYLVTLSQRATRICKSQNLCLSGGVALNSTANLAIAKSEAIEAVFIQPAAGDAGGALGAALYVANVLFADPRPLMTSAALGQGFDPKEVESFLDDCGVPFHRFESEEALVAEVASRLSEKQIGGWFHGRFEWGPRALGNRSILADPRDASTRDRVNAAVKFREAFRPFAPMVLADEVDQWFDEPLSARKLTPFMCTVLPARARAKEQLEAVVHVDGTSRVQVVGSDASPRLTKLLQAFRERTGIGALLNTSLNLKDEPICASPAEAYGAYLRSGMDFLVLENVLIDQRPTWKH